MPRGSFYFKNCKAFLTYAQCPVSKEEILTHLSSLGKLQEYVIGKEKHENGGFHLHCVLKYSPRIETRNSRYFDYNGYHPNIEIPSTKTDLSITARYAAKDGDFIQKGTLLKQSRTEMFSSLLSLGQLTASFMEQNPDILGLNFHSICAWLRTYRSLRNEFVPQTLPKKRHIWLYGPSNTGKTTWLRKYLAGFTHTCEIPCNNDWSSADTQTEILYHDEYKGHLAIQVVNSLCDGLKHLNTKGGSTNIGQPLVIFTSNYSIRDCYPTASTEELDTLYNRFKEFDSSITLP